MMFIGTLIFLLCAVSSGVGIEVKVGGADRSNTVSSHGQLEQHEKPHVMLTSTIPIRA